MSQELHGVMIFTWLLTDSGWEDSANISLRFFYLLQTVVIDFLRKSSLRSKYTFKIGKYLLIKLLIFGKIGLSDVTNLTESVPISSFQIGNNGMLRL